MVGRLAGGQDALVYRIDRSGQVRWSLSQVAGVQKAEEAVSPAEESIDLVGLEQTEVKSGCSRRNWSRQRFQRLQEKGSAQAKLYSIGRVWLKRQAQLPGGNQILLRD